MEADAFSYSDTALVSPVGLPLCGISATGTDCWGGPYVSHDPTASPDQTPPALIDAWGRPRLFTLVRPLDDRGGGTTGAPNGFVAIWSLGSDGVDGYGCSDGLCVRDLDRMAAGVPNTGADDVVLVVGAAR